MRELLFQNRAYTSARVTSLRAPGRLVHARVEDCGEIRYLDRSQIHDLPEGDFFVNSNRV